LSEPLYTPGSPRTILQIKTYCQTRLPFLPVKFPPKKKFGCPVNYRNIAIDMGLTKAEIFTEKQNKLASMMKALAHPARIAIIQYLIKSQACICGDLVEELGLAQATISQHLKELKNAGLIQGTIDGTSVCYCIDEKVWNQYKATFESFFVAYKNKDCC
jgi:DNA-binding transcriptional ArsR family regulator